MISQPVFNHDAHVRDYYDLREMGYGKFEGERRAVKAAYDMMLNGFVHGYYCRVTFEDCPFLVCFMEDEQGFVHELTNDEYEAAHNEYIEDNEEEDEPEDTPNQAQIRKHKEKLFEISMELESLASDLGYPYQKDIEEVAANIQDQCDVLEEMLTNDKDD